MEKFSEKDTGLANGGGSSCREDRSRPETKAAGETEETIAALQKKIQQYECSLQEIEYLAEEGTKSRIFKIAYVLHRWSREFCHGSRENRRDFRQWLGRKLSHKKTDEDFTYNLFWAIRRACSQPLGDLVLSPDYEREVQKWKQEIPELLNGKFLSHIVSEELWMDALNKKQHSTEKQIAGLIGDTNYKGILVYPPVIAWEPFQTPQQLLVAFAQQGWLCFFCDPFKTGHHGISKLQEGIWSVPADAFLRAVGEADVHVLLTWMGSVPFAQHIPHHHIWYHVLDKMDIFSLYDQSYLEMHNYICKKAEYVSYVAKALLEYIPERADTVYLPNACHAQELIATQAGAVPPDMEQIVRTGHPIIGYFGWMDTWMDYDMLESIALARPEYEYVMIGPHNEHSEEVNEAVRHLGTLKNVHFLGKKKYQELPAYARRFSVATIPFKINKMMDCVSPIKFYEYCSYGLPSIVSYMPEMENYLSDFVACYRTREEYLAKLDEFLTPEVQKNARENAPKLALENTWLARSAIMTQLFKKRE